MFTTLQFITTVITMPLAVGVFRRLLIRKEKNKTGREGGKSRKDEDEEEDDGDDEAEEIIERSKGGRSSETSTQRRGRHELKS